MEDLLIIWKKWKNLPILCKSTNLEGQSLQEIAILKRAKTAVVGFVAKIFKSIKRSAKKFLNFVIGEQKPTITTRKINFK